jgi:hypothetical protein
MDSQIKNIIRYLDGEMPENERIAFEQLMRNDEVLRKEVDFQRGFHGFLERRKPTLEQELSNLGDEFILNPTEGRKGLSIWWFSAIFLLLAMSLYLFYFAKKERTPERIPTNIETQENPIEEIDSVDENSNTIPQENIPDEPKRDKEVKEQDEQKSIPNQPIAALEADYKRHPIMEDFIQDDVRDASNEDTVSVTSPLMNATFKSVAEISFLLTGTTNVEPDYRIIIYSNKSYDIENDYRILNKAITGKEKSSGEYEFRFNAQIPLPKGLYYLMIRKEGSRDVLYTSRFSVL